MVTVPKNVFHGGGENPHSERTIFRMVDKNMKGMTVGHFPRDTRKRGAQPLPSSMCHYHFYTLLHILGIWLCLPPYDSDGREELAPLPSYSGAIALVILKLK